MLPLIAFGEVLIDFLQNPQAPDQFQRFAGGAPANVAVAFARQHGKAWFVGMVGADMFGDFLRAQLQAQQVNTDYLRSTTEAKTALAFVALDEQGDRSFSFYRPPAADLLYRATMFPQQLWQQPALFHLCSNSLTEDDIAACTLKLAMQATAAGAVVSVDANLRHNLWKSGHADRMLVLQLLRLAQLVKLSQDELDYLAEGIGEAILLETLLQAGVLWILITNGSAAVRSVTLYGEQQFAVPAITVVDTTAAGDAFVGGWLSQLAMQMQDQSTLLQLIAEPEKLSAVVHYAIACGAYACGRYGAFASLPAPEDIQSATA